MSEFDKVFDYSKCLKLLEERLSHANKRLSDLAERDQEDPYVIDSIAKANADIVGFENLRDAIADVQAMLPYYKCCAHRMFTELAISKGLFMAKMLYNCPQMICDWGCANPNFGPQLSTLTCAINMNSLNKAVLSTTTQDTLDTRHAPVMALGTNESYTPATLPPFNFADYTVEKYAWNVKMWVETR